MASPSPPKPWERAGAGGVSTAAMPTSTASPAIAATTTTAATPATAASSNPALPARPSSLTTSATQNAANLSTVNRSPYGTSPYGTSPYSSSPYSSSPYGGYGGLSSYSSPYNRFGSSMYGGMGSYGGMGGYGGYGGMGGMYGGMGGMYGGMNGMDPNNPSLTQSFGQSTQATFQLIEGIVGAFGGFAQMLESTYMATHSSFFAMVSVAEQFGNLRQTLGSVLGIYTVMRWIRNLFARLTGRPPPASATDLTPANFAAFSGAATLPDGSPAPAKPSRKPLIFFALAVFGLPYLMGKLIRALARGQEEEERRRLAAAGGVEGAMVVNEQGVPVLDPSRLEFCRVLYDFTPESNAQTVQGVDLAVRKNDLVAVLSKSDPLGNPSEWWRCRARDGRMGYLPAPYLEPIQRNPKQLTMGESSRVQTMTGSEGEAAAGMLAGKTVDEAPPVPAGKMGDIGVESFQKGQFYS